MKKKILIYGVGPFGSLFAERLSEAGHAVSLLDHGERQQELKTHGIVIENTETGVRTVTHLPIVESLGEEDYYDLVIVPIRKNKVSAILPALAANKHVPTFLFMMNNAAGQQEFIDVLGKERVMAGFPLPGGYKKGHVMYMMPVEKKNTTILPIGEVDGSVTTRTREVAKILSSMRGYRAEIQKDIDAWLKTQVAILIPTLVPAFYACDSDLERFAATRDAQVLMKRALHESLLATKNAGIPITPPAFEIMDRIPEPLFVMALGKMANTPPFENAVEQLKASEDEIEFLTDEFYTMIQPGNTPTPTVDRLTAYTYGKKEPLPAGSKSIPLNWRPLYGAAIGLAAIAGAAVMIKKQRNGNGHRKVPAA
ncbi:MAG TPA: 2-dehydropantoate 2-reductase N-terminal domain-containing protein [Planococcus sp. (in: firmicutes)]|nr:2-dehydropantoate 2-reductase N-terminal domain-containing protein [Planococcus sp. (in: firmicutes)]